MSDWIADPLEWGQGPRVFEVFLEPTCPFSGRAFPKLFELADLAGPDRVTVKIRLQSQPWHLFSGFICRAVLAASTLPQGREAARRLMAAVYARREAFEFEKHCAGPNLDTSPNQLIDRLEAESGLSLRAAYLIPDLDREMRWQCKYARQNGIHASPTFMLDGLIRPEISSGDPVEKWLAALG